MEKTTYTTKNILAAIMAIAGGLEDQDFGNGVTPEVIATYADKQIAAIERKNEKAREKKAAGDELKSAVAAVLTNEYQTREEIMAQIEGEELTVNKIGARLTQLVADLVAEKDKIKTEDGRTVMGYRLAGSVSEAEDAE